MVHALSACCCPSNPVLQPTLSRCPVCWEAVLHPSLNFNHLHLEPRLSYPALPPFIHSTRRCLLSSQTSSLVPAAKHQRALYRSCFLDLIQTRGSLTGETGIKAVPCSSWRLQDSDARDALTLVLDMMQAGAWLRVNLRSR